MANKKINQLVSKTSILSTDLFGIGDATTGQLFKKTIAELQAAIGGAVISVNGLVGTVVLDTDDIQELATPTNKYFTDARARGAISLTVTGNSGASTYSSGTGVLNVPTYTLAGLGGITASFLSGTSGISYNSTTGVISYSGTVYTDSSIRALLSGGTGITYNSSTGAISYSGTVYTDSSVRALISITTTGTSGASTYNNTTGVINVPEYTLAGLGGISLTSLSGGTGITYNNTTGAISYSGTVYTDASVRALISASGSVSYNNTTGVISLTGGNLTEATSSVLTITGGTGAVIGGGTSIQVKQATTSVSGFLSSTDWTTFNNKANALSGTTNYVAKFTSSSAIGNSNIQDSGTIITLGMSQITIGTSGSQFFIYPAFSANLNLLQNYNGSAYTTEEHRASDYNFKIGTTSALTIASTGAATFSSSVTAKTGYFLTHSNATTVFRVEEFSGTQGAGLSMYNSSGVQNIQFNAGGDSYIKGGNVGIGTTSPTRLLDVSNTSGDSTIAITSADTTGQSSLFFAKTSDSNIGGVLYTHSDNSMVFRVNDAERMRITAAGNVGIGSSPTNSTLEVRANADTISWGSVATLYGYLTFGTSGSFGENVAILKTPASTGIIFQPAGTERMRITSAGNVGINNNSPGVKLEVNNNGAEEPVISINSTYADGYRATLRLKNTHTGGKNWELHSTNTSDGAYGAGKFGIRNASDSVYALTIAANGNILINTLTDNGYKLYVSGTIYATGNITANSDLTLKKNLELITNPIDKLMQLNGYSYQWKSDDSHQYGVIAQEVEKILPYAVSTGYDGIKGVSYNQIIPVLIEAVKEQKKELEELRDILASK